MSKIICYSRIDGSPITKIGNSFWVRGERIPEIEPLRGIKTIQDE